MAADAIVTQQNRDQVPPQFSITGIWLIAAYIAVQMLADLGSLKIVRFRDIALLSQLSIDGGTFVYPLTFTLRDLVHKALGRQAARTVIVAAGVINVFMAAYLALLSRMPPDPAWPFQEAFSNVLGPVWRIVAASIVAEVISELLDTEVYHLWVTRVTRRFQWSRVLVSNAVGVPVDSLIFVWLAFGGVLPAVVVWSIFWANVLVKGLTTLVSLPGIYLVKGE